VLVELTTFGGRLAEDLHERTEGTEQPNN
jgi:hypothetical protein